MMGAMATGRGWWYRATARPLFLALPPETSHRVATTLLGVPLPWRRIGAVEEDLALETELCGIRLRNPVGLAAGFDKTCRHLDALGSLGFGYVVGGTVTRSARAGNAAPRIARSRRHGSLVNAMGLPNPGAEAVAATLRGRAAGPAPRLASVADEALDDAVSTAELLAPHVDGLELNASCPNVSWGRDRDTEAHLRQLVSAIRSRTGLPLFVKLPPFVTVAERTGVLALAALAIDAGASGVTCSNTRPVGDARLAVGGGGLSGRALRPHTPRIVGEVRAAVGDDPAVNACGGIASGDDVARCLDAGATTVQVYTAFVYGGPPIVGELVAGARRAAPVLRGT